MSPTLVAGGHVENVLVNPSSTRVVYIAAQDHPDVVELYSVPIGGGAVVQLNPEFSPGP